MNNILYYIWVRQAKIFPFITFICHFISDIEQLPADTLLKCCFLCSCSSMLKHFGKTVGDISFLQRWLSTSCCNRLQF